MVIQSSSACIQRSPHRLLVDSAETIWTVAVCSNLIGLRDLSHGEEMRLTGGNCNSSSPAWELDSKSIVFASDCGRAFGLPALYRPEVGTKEN
jgi:hypothetical protein